MVSRQAALVIGACSHGLSVIRALHSKGVKVFVVEKNTDIAGVKSSAISKLFLVKNFSSEELLLELPRIRESLSTWDDVVLFATNDNHVKFICDYYDSLIPHFKISWVQQKDIIKQLIDKRNLEEYSTNVGLNYPKSATLENIEQLSHALDLYRFPVIVKPAKPLSSFKTQIANHVDDVRSLIVKFESDLPFIVQEYIEGDDQSLFFCALMLQNGEIKQSLTGQKLASFPPARGQTTIAQTVINEDVEQLTANFFSQFTLSGPVSLEMKKAPDNTYWVIEPTVGRTDFWSELCIQAGFNQPYQEYLIALNQTLHKEKRLTSVIWFDGERDPVNYFKICWKQKTFKPFGKTPAFTYFSLTDIKPFILACVSLLKRIIFKP